MNEQNRKKLFQKNIGLYRCPLCHAGFALDDGSLVCASGHVFDIAAKGYVNFLSAARTENYKSLLFESRRSIFEEGFYLPVVEELSAMICERRHGVILDAGCGEGYYARELAARTPNAKMLAMDIEKNAIKMAAGLYANCFVSDLAKIPLRDQSVDVILNVLSPANYREFQRVLIKGGAVIKVFPGSGYLKEIREMAQKESAGEYYSNQKMTEHFQNNMCVTDRREVQYEMPVTPEQARWFVDMTPMTKRLELRNIDRLRSITIHVEILAGQSKS